MNKGCHNKQHAQDPGGPNGEVGGCPEVGTVGETDVEGVEYKGKVGADSQHGPQGYGACEEALASCGQEAADSQE
eukprot:CAMPEP_0181520370 /NCGR_PEP_ID=MMETSP1110-20121109/66271_1 /TAXON_ID=174948 /ORGANISM="Symbiodinium sp., Strain CCMP421" /LENGTH=74 /DNA_ID=CAMNT_0023650849 /DNA_START=5 /DNA_END=229 /DNA_ORIENTATION=+